MIKLIKALLFLFILWQSYRTLKNVHDRATDLIDEDVEDFGQFYFALVVSLIVILTCGLTITMIYTEVVWLLLMLPVCLRRALDNRLIETQPQKQS